MCFGFGNLQKCIKSCDLLNFHGRALCLENTVYFRAALLRVFLKDPMALKPK